MIIGIPIDLGRTKYQINKAYIDYVSEAGYLPYLVTPHTKAEVAAEMCNGLLLPGGIDIDPLFYGESNWGSMAVDPEKDDFERQLLWAFINVKKPIFGICRGFQLIAREYIYHSGDVPLSPKSDKEVADLLVFGQHISDHALTENFGLFRTIPSHYVNARMDLLCGEDSKDVFQAPVNSMHHQYLHIDVEDEDRLESKVKVTPHMWLTAWTTRGLDKKDDGVVAEGFILKGWKGTKIAAVQWHPEELRDYSLIQFHFGKSELEPIAAVATKAE